MFLHKVAKICTRNNGMSIKEVLYRSRQELSKGWERFQIVLSRNVLGDEQFFKCLNLDSEMMSSVKIAVKNRDYTLAKEKLKDYFKNRTSPKFFFSPQEKDILTKIIEENFPVEMKNTIEEANRILEHRFNLLGYKEINFGPEIDWHADYINKKRAPIKFWADIPILDIDIVGDHKVIWEINRHQHFLTLGQAYWYTGNEEYVKEFVSQIKSWIVMNPIGIGINWASSLELGLRTISWIWAYQFFLPSKHFDANTQCEMLKLLIFHARHIQAHLSYYFAPNNHLTGEGLSLFYLGIMFPEFKESMKWRQIGLSILENEIQKQVFEDGVFFEQSSHYHRFTVDFYLQLLILAKHNKISISKGLLDKLERMLEVIMYSTTPNGEVPMIGDEDGGKSLFPGRGNLWNHRDCLATAAILFNRGDMKVIAGNKVYEETFWYIGKQCFEEFELIDSHEPYLTSKAFNQGGWFIMRSGWQPTANFLFFDCAPLGADIMHAGHGHVDMLSFELHAYGCPILIDAGTYTYVGSSKWRSYFRGTSAHNTVVVDCKNQAEESGAFSWTSIPNIKLISWTSNKEFDFVEGEHNGFQRLPNPITHKRRILFIKPEYWIVDDILLGEGQHYFQLFFHFIPCKISIDKATKVITTVQRDKANLKIGVANFETLEVGIFEGDDPPQGGWISQKHGSKIPAPVVNYSKTVEAPTTFTTVLYPFKGNSEPRISIEELPVSSYSQEICSGNIKCFRIKIDQNIDYVLLCNKSKSIQKSYEEIFTNTEVVYLRKNSKGQTIRSFAHPSRNLQEMLELLRRLP